jgi:TonB-linked SusC/RagA family outer membrane protein
MKHKLLKIFMVCFFCTASMAFAQNKTVTGTVTAKDDGLPIPGVTVKIKGTTTGAQTNANGKYTLSAPTGATLVFSFIGYSSIEKPAADVVNAVLIPATNQLAEVLVTTALGINREARSLGYSVGSIKGDDLTKSRETNVLNSLQGKIAGVKISPSSGGLNSSSKIVIRGGTSLTGDNQPIFVIDGLPVDNSAQQLQTVSSSVPSGISSADFGNRAADIPEDDIESVNVLKGAAAAALYGSRAKNGAIIITTKKGKKGQATIDFNSSVRFDNILVKPQFQNEYAQGQQGIYNLGSLNGWGPKISEVANQKFPNFLGQQVTLQAYPNNYNDFFQTGNTFLNSLAMAGADDNGDYRVTFNNTIQTGTIPLQKLNKNSISINAGRKLPYGFDIRTNINYTRTNNVGLATQSSNDPNVLGSTILGLPRTVDINQVRNNYLDSLGHQNTLTPARNGNNPYWIMNNNIISGLNNHFYGNAIFSYKPTSWLSFSDNVGTDYYNEFRQALVRPGTIGALTGSLFTANLYNRTINNDFLVTTDNKLTKDLGLKVIGGYSMYDTYYQRDQSFGENLTVDQLYNFANAASVTTTNTSSRKRIQGVFADVGFSYKNWLYLNATARNDWSSTLPIKNNSYFYPSVSSSFVFSELIGPNKWLSSGKLRVSYAKVGGDTNPYLLDFAYIPVSSLSAQYSLSTTFPFNGALGFSAPGQIPGLDKLKPQNQNTFEVGTELQFFNERLGLDLAYYNNKTTDQIVALALPRSTGFATILTNAGDVKNSGIEFTLRGSPFKNRDGFSWNIDVNFNRNRQTATLPPSLPSLTIASGWSGLLIKAETGKPNGMYGTGWLRDPQGNIIIDPATGLRKIASNVRLGNVDPDWTGGINNTFSYKAFSLSFLLDIHKGGVVFSNTVSSLRTSGLGKETAANRGNIFIDKGVIQNANGTFTPNTVPVQSMQDYWSQYSTSNTEANVFDASFIKLREALFMFQLPTSFLQKHAKFFKAASIGIEGRNLWIIQKNVPDIDPEVNFFGASSGGGAVEFNSQPSTRTIGFNLRIKL